MNTPLKAELFESVHRFIVAAANDEVSETQAAEFSRLLQESDEACDIYAECVQMSLLLPSLLATGAEESFGAGDTDFPPQNRDAVGSPGLSFLGTGIQSTVGYLSSGWPMAYCVAAMVLGMGLLIGSLIPASGLRDIAWHRSTTPGLIEALPGSPVARITGMVDCRFEERSEVRDQRSDVGWVKRSAAPPKQHIQLGDRFVLLSGLMEITYDSGAKVILQAPCTYEVESPTGGFLSLGKLTARVEKKVESRESRVESHQADAKPKASDHSPLSTLHSPLFSVRTPTATITDLGTEFAVEVDQQGQTTSHVFRGSVKVEMQAGRDGGANQAIVLHEGEGASARKVSAGRGQELCRTSVDPSAFIRRIARSPQTLDLLDIVAGGYGTTGRRERGIDATSGMEDPVFSVDYRNGDGNYRCVTWHRLIDGVFTPSGGDGPVVVDSAGHTFDGFPPTSRLADSSIWSRAFRFKTDDRAENPRYWVYAMGQGEQYMPRRSGLLGLATNKGITFDLGAIRAEYPGATPVRFRAVTAVADATTLGLPEGEQTADIWVLVDGRLEFGRQQVHPQDGILTVDVALQATDGFLTLATTWNGNGRNYDWVVFGDPVLEMAAVASSEASPAGKEVR